LMMILSMVLARVHTPLRVIHYIIAFTVIGLTLMLYSRIIVNRFSKVRVGKFIAFSLIFGVCLTLAFGIYGLIMQPDGFGDVLRGISKAWLLIGAGLGLGFEFTELLIPDVKHDQEI